MFYFKFGYTMQKNLTLELTKKIEAPLPRYGYLVADMLPTTDR